MDDLEFGSMSDWFQSSWFFYLGQIVFDSILERPKKFGLVIVLSQGDHMITMGGSEQELRLMYL